MRVSAIFTSASPAAFASVIAATDCWIAPASDSLGGGLRGELRDQVRDVVLAGDPADRWLLHADIDLLRARLGRDRLAAR